MHGKSITALVCLIKQGILAFTVKKLRISYHERRDAGNCMIRSRNDFPSVYIITWHEIDINNLCRIFLLKT